MAVFRAAASSGNWDCIMRVGFCARGVCVCCVGMSPNRCTNRSEGGVERSMGGLSGKDSFVVCSRERLLVDFEH